MSRRMRRALFATVTALSCLGGTTVIGIDRRLPENYNVLETPEERVRCLRADEMVVKWLPKLKLQDYDLEVICGVPDDWRDEEANGTKIYGASVYDATHRNGKIWVNPKLDEKDAELIVIHELIHAVINEVVVLGSNAVQERIVYTLSELIYVERGK